MAITSISRSPSHDDGTLAESFRPEPQCGVQCEHRGVQVLREEAGALRMVEVAMREQDLADTHFVAWQASGPPDPGGPGRWAPDRPTRPAGRQAIRGARCSSRPRVIAEGLGARTQVARSPTWPPFHGSVEPITSGRPLILCSPWPQHLAAVGI